VLVALLRSLRSWISPESTEIVRINPTEPYYSALQVAIWRRDYLQNLLANSGTIWNFEHLQTPGSLHFAVRHKFLNYEHLVEKGKWNPFALSLIVNFNPKYLVRRDINWRHGRVQIYFDKIKFAIFGYSIFKTKRALKKLFRRARKERFSKPKI